MNKLFIGLLAGIAAGILFAPDKGSVTRQQLRDNFDDVSDKLAGFKEKFSRKGANEPKDREASSMSSII